MVGCSHGTHVECVFLAGQSHGDTADNKGDRRQTVHFVARNDPLCMKEYTKIESETLLTHYYAVFRSG